MANKAITTEYLEEIVAAFNRHDLDAIGSYFAPDGRFLTARGSGAHGNELVGSAAICEYLGQRYELIPDMRWIGESHFISGNRALSDWTVPRNHARWFENQLARFAISGTLTRTARSARRIPTGSSSSSRRLAKRVDWA